MRHGDTEGVVFGVYNTKSGEEIHENRTVKDLGILTSKDVSFSEHIDDLVQTSKIKAGMLLRTTHIRNLRKLIK